MSVLIVTGASRGIGAEIGRLAARRSWAVCINYATSEEEAEAVAEQIVSEGGKAMWRGWRSEVSLASEQTDRQIN